MPTQENDQSLIRSLERVCLIKKSTQRRCLISRPTKENAVSGTIPTTISWATPITNKAIMKMPSQSLARSLTDAIMWLKMPIIIWRKPT